MSEQKKQEQEIAVKEIVITIGRKEVRLAPAEAEKLLTALQELLGKKVVHVHDNHWYWQPYYYTVPVPAFPTTPLYPNITCGAYGVSFDASKQCINMSLNAETNTLAITGSLSQSLAGAVT